MSHIRGGLCSLAGLAVVAGLGVAIYAGGTVAALADAEGLSALKHHDVQTPIDISADRLEVRSKESIAVFEGRVQADQGDLTLSADRVTVYYQGDGSKEATSTNAATNAATNEADKAPAISRIDAAGNVKLTSPTETASGSWGVYDMEKRVITVGGSVLLTRNGTMVKGDRMQIDLNSGISRLDAADMGAGQGKGRVRGRFTPTETKN